MLEQLNAFLAMAGDPEGLSKHNADVSAWSVGQQLEHLALAGHSILDAMEQIVRGDHAEDAGKEPNRIGRFVLVSGRIPRGKGQAPDSALPKDVDAGVLVADLLRMRERCAALDPNVLDDAVGTVAHFAFGHLNACQWLRFIQVHNDHHGKIIRDIEQ